MIKAPRISVGRSCTGAIVSGALTGSSAVFLPSGGRLARWAAEQAPRGRLGRGGSLRRVVAVLSVENLAKHLKL